MTTLETTTFVLIVWEEIPETTVLYALPESIVGEEEKKMLRLCAGHYINVDNESKNIDEALDQLSNMLAGPWKAFRVFDTDNDHLFERDISAVYVTGFLM